LGIAEKPDGYEVAADILAMRLHSDNERKEATAPEIEEAGCVLIDRLTFDRSDHREGYDIESIMKCCLGGEQGTTVVQSLCRRLRRSVENRETYAFHHADLLRGLFSAQPVSALNGLCAGDPIELERGIRIIGEVRGQRANPLDSVPDDELLKWCDEDPDRRYPAIASVVTISCAASESDPQQWTAIALRLLGRAPNQLEVLKQFVRQFTPRGVWSGSLASILEANARLLDVLDDVEPAARQFIAQERLRLGEIIDAERRRETRQDRVMDERFE
jgi:hypothetical protein